VIDGCTNRAAAASAWARRGPEVALALVGAAIATYLALYQWRVVPSLPDPLFGPGSASVLDSPIAHTLPIPDATLGVGTYLLEAVAGAGGGRERWRTQPWIVVGFGLLATGLGLVGLLLILAQALVVRAWCSLCLASAVISFILFTSMLSELAATLRYLGEVRATGRPLWSAFWGRAASAERAR
jgi:hypothetical protein